MSKALWVWFPSAPSVKTAARKNGWPHWVVHCQPVGNGLNALKYLAPYIFRVAISNRRILKVENGLRQTVTPTGESPGLASDPPKNRSPRTG